MGKTQQSTCVAALGVGTMGMFSGFAHCSRSRKKGGKINVMKGGIQMLKKRKQVTNMAKLHCVVF